MQVAPQAEELALRCCECTVCWKFPPDFRLLHVGYFCVILIFLIYLIPI